MEESSGRLTIPQGGLGRTLDDIVTFYTSQVHLPSTFSHHFSLQKPFVTLCVIFEDHTPKCIPPTGILHHQSFEAGPHWEEVQRCGAHCGNKVARCSSGTAAMISTSLGGLSSMYLITGCIQQFNITIKRGIC